MQSKAAPQSCPGRDLSRSVRLWTPVQRQLFDGLHIKHQIKKKKVLLAGGVGIQTSPHHQMFLTETAPVTVMDGEHFTLPDIFWMTC